jgi:hypothetical protein
MNETQPTLERLEMRIEDQTARIDALYGLLELRGILPRETAAPRGDEAPRRRRARRAAHFHLGEATGV